MKIQKLAAAVAVTMAIPVALGASGASGAVGAESAQRGAPSARPDRIAAQVLHAVDGVTTPTRAQLARMPITKQASALAFCEPLAGQYYCLGLGFREDLPDYARLVAASDDGSFAPMGDKPFATWVRERASMPTAKRRAAEERELRDAYASQDKVQAIQRVLKNVEDGRPVVSLDSMRDTPAKAPDDGRYVFIMNGKQTRQVESNWCGPATFQMIDWGGDGTRQSQASWARRLGTTSGGTAISDMVRLTNSFTDWDRAAGRYVVQPIANWSADKMWGVHLAHLGDGSPAPIIEHPELQARFYRYLHHDGDGHFQVGRGFQQLKGSNERSVAIFEPWNEADWYPGGSVTWGPHLVPVVSIMKAAKANSLQNIGL